MGREFAERGSAGVMDDELPNSFLVGDEFPHHPIPLIDPPEDLPFRNFRGSDPRIDPHLHRGRYGNVRRRFPLPTRSGMTQRPSPAETLPLEN
jgi:hypothetical protein